MRALLCAFALLLACDDDICPNEYGNAYSCTCSRRCNGVTDTWTTSFSCFTSGSPTSSANSSCESSCSPQATCSCSCAEGASCEIDHESCH
jgi:hypothetical protein